MGRNEQGAAFHQSGIFPDLGQPGVQTLWPQVRLSDKQSEALPRIPHLCCKTQKQG